MPDLNNADLTLRPVEDDDIIEIRDDDGVVEITDPAQTESETQTPGQVDDVPLDDERWLDCQTIVIVRPPEPVERRNKACQVRPIKITKEVQTDSEELWEMPRVEMKIPEPEEKIRYVPVPIPYPILIPFPFYALDRPIPVPFPIGIPVPIPIPLDMKLFANQWSSSSISSLTPALALGLNFKLDYKCYTLDERL